MLLLSFLTQPVKVAVIVSVKDDSLFNCVFLVLGNLSYLGGPGLTHSELNALKIESDRLKARVQELTTQLSSTLNTNAHLLEQHLLEETAKEALHTQLNQLHNDLSAILAKLSELHDTDDFKQHLVELQQLLERIAEIASDQKKVEEEIRQSERCGQLLLSSGSGSGIMAESEFSEQHEMHTNQQMALNTKLQELSKMLAVKEQLAMQMVANRDYSIDQKDVEESEARIVLLQKERDELEHQLKALLAGGENMKVAENRRKRIVELESNIHDYRMKVELYFFNLFFLICHKHQLALLSELTF